MSSSDKKEERSKFPGLLKVNEVAKLLKLHVRSIWRMRSTGKIPEPIKLAGSVRWRALDIENWIANGCPPQDSCNN